MTNYKFKMTMAVPPPPSSNNKNSNNKRSRKSAGPAPYLFVILLVVASSSLFHSVHLLSTSEDNALKASLKDFTTSGQRKKIDKKKSDSSISQEQEEDPTWIDQKEDPVPNPNPIADGNATFSSCLLIMDDNHRLVEWMAYHYHVLPLRYLIVAVDPRSRTSPNRILNRWRKMGMYIEEWDDFHFLKPGIARNVVPDTAALQIKRDRHRIRQKNFYHECLMHLKTANRTWVTLIDTDEFLTYNHKGGADFEEWERQQQALHEASKFREKVRIRPSQPPPTTAQEGALVHYLRQEQAAGLAFFQRSCISCPRLQFGAKESTPEERANSVPEDLTIDPDRLDTLRFRRHGHRQDFVKNGLSKSIIDVSRIEIPFPKIQSLHRPIKTICTAPWKDEWSSGLRINHYLGSWEAYSFRDDSRRGGERSKEGWAFKAQDADDTDDNIRPWVSGFVESHGTEKANDLLRGAGLPRGYSHDNNNNWTIIFLDEILGMNETVGNDARVAFDTFVRDFHHNNQSTEGLKLYGFNAND